MFGLATIARCAQSIALSADGEDEQHEAPERIDCYVYRTDHLKIAELIEIGSGRN